MPNPPTTFPRANEPPTPPVSIPANIADAFTHSFNLDPTPAPDHSQGSSTLEDALVDAVYSLTDQLGGRGG
ncbi:uncharacterized protein GLRG_06996 [Colletotrichum graminicola M1.001]|uniref:Uncharacterized protein n=1 Tax=Colletotrichum graminicola (strain M1.001 / M2 / FGSC 10212) TaxID=645133 RepID=E3QLW4_COLGM|nr:uncharacterized protein GLRG_06996 [Colletotrichum graminicola M1.001]EFQ31852.1 hypothetical protein GLRG_06996 [Colletotrichum graminicola M1.001]